MAVANVIRVSILGSHPNGEVWSVNPVFQIGGVSTAEDVTAEQCLTMATAVDAIAVPTGLLNIMCGGTAFTGCRIEARRWDGTLSAQAEHARSPQVFGSGTVVHPMSVAMVTSLRSTLPGASGRGRMYWPATGLTLQVTTMRPSTSLVTSALSAVKTYLTSIGAALDVTLTNSPVLSVWSRTNDITTPVNALNMGDVLDTQRRRRDGLLEAYSSTSWP